MAINKDFIIPDAGLQVNGAAVISSSLGVNGAATIANTLTVNGALTVANTIAVGNTTVTGNVNVSVAANVGGAIRAGGLITGAAGADITGTANASVAINVGANVNLSVSAVNVGNSTSNTVVTQTSVNTGNSTLFTTIGQATGLFGNSTVNTFITNSSIRTGNSSVYTNVTATALTTNGTLSVTGNTTLSGANLVVSGHTTISNAVVISGNLTVSGTTTYVNTATLNVSDNIIALNTDVTLAPSENAGVEVNRGTSSNVSLIWNETTDRWQISSNTSTFGNIHSTLADVALGTDTSGDYVATITSGNGLTGTGSGEGSTPTLAVVAGTELTSNSSGVHHNDITRTNTTTGNTSPNYAGTFTTVDSVTTNARGHVTGVNTKTVTMPSSNNTTYDLLAVANTTASNAILRLTDSGASSDSVFFVGTDEVVTSSNATHIIIDHADVARSDGSSAASPNYGGTFTAVDSVTTNVRGHVTAINVKTVTMPPANNTTYDLATVANTAANEGLVNLVGSNSTTDTAKIIGLDEIAVSSNATAVYVDHNDVARSDGTSSASPASGGTFTAVDSVTTNARGHVTGLNLKTVTLPVDPNTTYTGANGVILAGTVFSANVGATLVANATGIHMPAVATAGTSTGGLSAITIDAQGRVTSVTGSAGYLTSAVTSVTGTAGRVTSSGGTTPAIDLATAGAGAASYSTGISAITVDAYGRVTSVTGSAGYVTSSGVTSVTGTTGRITSSGGATPTIDLATAGAGALSYSTGISAITVDAYGRVTSVTGSAGYTTNAGTVTSVTGGNGLTGSITASGSLAVGAGNGISVSADEVYLATTTAGTGLTYTNGVLSVDLSNGATAASGKFYTGTTNPSATTRLNYSGNLYTTNLYAITEVFAAASDDRLKTNVAPITSALAKLQSLDGFTFNWNETANELAGFDITKQQIGVSAQQIQQVLPEAVGPAPFDIAEDGSSKSGENYLTVQYEKIVPLLIEAIKELQAEVADLKSGRLCSCS
jgi:hypothetical protein